MDIVDFIRECVEQTEIKSFGHGTRSYANLEQEQEAAEQYGFGAEFPRAWLYPVEAVDEILKSGAISRTYNLAIDITALTDISASSKDLEEALRVTGLYATQLQIQIGKHESFLSWESKITRIANYQFTDACQTGWSLSFSIKIKEEFVYCR